MRRILASAAAIALVAGTASIAVAKDHTMPADSADAFGQPNADENYVIGGETAKVDATGTVGIVKFVTDKGIDDSEVQTTAAQTIERPATRGKSPK
jgi:hypothetical protein